MKKEYFKVAFVILITLSLLISAIEPLFGFRAWNPIGTLLFFTLGFILSALTAGLIWFLSGNWGTQRGEEPRSEFSWIGEEIIGRLCAAPFVGITVLIFAGNITSGFIFVAGSIAGAAAVFSIVEPNPPIRSPKPVRSMRRSQSKPEPYNPFDEDE